MCSSTDSTTILTWTHVTLTTHVMPGNDPADDFGGVNSAHMDGSNYVHHKVLTTSLEV